MPDQVGFGGRLDEWHEIIALARDAPALPADELPVLQRQRVVSGDGVGEVARNETAPAGRVCADEDCSTVLSIYNVTTRCSIHAGARTQRHPRTLAITDAQILDARTPTDPQSVINRLRYAAMRDEDE